MAHYDLLVIGTGPAGQKAAIQAAKLGKKVGIVERKRVVGGVCTNTGTIPSKSLREAALYLSGFHQRSLYGASYRVKQDITMEDLTFRANHVINREIEIIQNQMTRNNVDLWFGTASFIDPHRLRIERADDLVEHTADFVVVACGTVPARPSHIPFDDHSIIDTDGLLTLKTLPKSITIIGGGVIGAEYASILATMGIHVTLCLLYTSDAADERSSVDLGGRRIIKTKKPTQQLNTTKIYERQNIQQCKESYYNNQR